MSLADTACSLYSTLLSYHASWCLLYDFSVEDWKLYIVILEWTPDVETMPTFRIKRRRRRSKISVTMPVISKVIRACLLYEFKLGIKATQLIRNIWHLERT